jgi:hypothetical protein
VKQFLRPADATVVAEKLLYDCALELGKEGAVQEVYKNYTKSAQMYTNGLLLLEQLLSDVTLEFDKEILQKCIFHFFFSSF